jgi:uncharacterized protein
MKQFLYRLQLVRVAMLVEGPTAEEAAIVGEHFNYLAKLTEDGVVLLAGRTLTTDERTFGIVVFIAPSESEARELMNGDPTVKKGVMKAELFPFSVALWSSKGPGASEKKRLSASRQ